MNCKNCNTPLFIENKFCPNCGGKVIRKRLTFKSLINEFSENYFNWDNRLFMTFIHLFTKPEEVINSYIDGVRKRYMAPFSFFMLSLSLYGLFMYFGTDATTKYMDSMYSMLKNKEDMSSFGNFIIKNMNLVMMINIPFYAFLSYIIFRKQKFNFVEHIILNTYITASFSFLNLIISILGIIISQEVFNSTQNLLFIFQIVYSGYAYKRVFNLKLEQIFIKVLWLILYLIVFLILSMVAGVIFVIISKKFFA